MNKRLFLRTCNADMTSYNGFKWPKKVGSVVTAPDWEPTKECGHGLHGLLDGGQDGCYLDYGSDPVWMVVEADLDKAIDLDGKYKFESCEIKFIGNQKEATDYLMERGCVGVHGASVVVGNYGTAIAGSHGTAIAGSHGTATAGDCGTATAGNYGTATAGYEGTATAGNCGTTTAGNWGTATAGSWGTATAGNRGTIQIRYWDSKADRYKIKTGYIGEEGLEANVEYRFDGKKFVKVED